MIQIFIKSMLLISGLCLFCFPAFPQFGQDVQLPTIIPPSPTAQNFMRYGEIPIDHSTGVPNIAIPLYTVKGRKLEVPISISYHASGIKVRDIASEVGLGWVLNAGGMVSRTINDKRDEAKSRVRTFFNSAELLDSLTAISNIWNSSCTCLEGIMNFEHFLNQNFTNEEDAMNDRYFYRLPDGTSGVFTYDYDDFEEENGPVTMPYRPYKIEKHINDSGPVTSRIERFKITDDNGTVYQFASYLEGTPRDFSEWYLKEIISADGKDNIKFYYRPQNPEYSIPARAHIYQSKPKNYNPWSDCQISDKQSSMYTSFSQSFLFNAPILDSIVSAETIVKFYYKKDREDFGTLNRLDYITISPASNQSNAIKKIKLMPRYFGNADEDKRLGLDRLIISSIGNSYPQEYSFAYESRVLPPYPFKMSVPKYSEDFWGYYNGANSNSLIPKEFITLANDQNNYGGNRNPDPTNYYSKACMLKEIKYPTGGRTVFQFERLYADNAFPNRDNPDGYYGGFRVASITNYDEKNETTSVKTYEYGQSLINPVRRQYFSYDQFRMEESSPPTHVGEPAGCSIFYAREMVFSNPFLPLERAPGMPLMYTEVVEYQGTKTDNVGKTVYKYASPPFDYKPSWHYHPYHNDRGNYVPRLASRTEYSFNGTGYHPLFRERNLYSTKYPSVFNTGIKVSRVIRYDRPTYFVFSGCGIYGCGWELQEVITQYVNSIVALDTKAYQEATLLTRTERYDFDPLDSTQYILAAIDYIYNETNLAVSEKLTVSSEDDTVKTFYSYPHDLKSIQPYKSMFERGILNPIVEERHYNLSQSNKLIGRRKIKYKDWGNSIIAPEHIEFQWGSDAPVESRIRFLSYDSYGNVTAVKKDDGEAIAYLWGYNGLYPVAEVRGADYLTVSNFVNLNLIENAARYSDEQVRAELNKIRIGLSSSTNPFLLTTYTYRPSIGIASQTDSNGKRILFGYDNVGRLQSIKDHNDDIVKTYEYHYQK